MSEEIITTNENEEDFASLLEQSFRRVYKNNRVTATVVAINKNEAVVELGTKQTGYIPLEELTSDPNAQVSDVVSVGDKISVVVKSFDPEKKRVSLSAKDPEDNPWTKFVAEYNKDDVIKATVVSITEFGAFAQIIPGVDGLIHISQVAAEPVQDINTVLKVGQVVDVKIIEINEEKNRVSLSIRALAENSEE